MAKGIADISNTSVRIFLHKIGKAYDVERSFQPYTKSHFPKVKLYFENSCCFCGVGDKEKRLTGDHLVPSNKTSLGLEAWGNIVPACESCNEKKHHANWKQFMQTFSDSEVSKRLSRIEEFILEYNYAPDLNTISIAVIELYEEAGGIINSLIESKLKRALERMRVQ
jgi:hypothetical protein